MPQPWKHPSGIYYVRLKVPDDLRPILRRREHKRSLNTRDAAEAKRLYPAEYLKALQEFDLARAQLAGARVLTDNDIGQLAARWYRQESQRMDAGGSFGRWLVEDTATIEAGATLEVVPIFRTLRDALDDAEDEARLSAEALRCARAVFREHGLPMPLEGTAAWNKVNAAFAEYLLKLSDLAFARTQGDWRADSTVLPPAPLQIEANAKGKGGSDARGLMHLYEGYAKEKTLNDGDTRSVRKTLGAYKSVVEQFTELCDDPPLSRIDRETMQQYRGYLVKLPAKGEGIRKLSAKRLIEKADAENLPRVSAATVRNKLLALSAIFSYGVRMGSIAENPIQAGGIGKAAKRAASVQAARLRRRKDYTHDEIEQIFTSAIYEGGWTPPKADFGKAWYWMPLLLYYTGARREELAQLMVRDVKFSGGPTLIPYISILATYDDDDDDDDDEGRGVKTQGSRRVIPIHHDLITRGFLKYVEGLAPEGQLFPKLTPNPQGFYGANFGKRWGLYVRDVVGIRNVGPSHGFRHTFKTLCREVGIPEEVHDAITGHSGQGGAGRGYGEMPLDRMAEELAKYPLAITDEAELPSDIQPL